MSGIAEDGVGRAAGDQIDGTGQLALGVELGVTGLTVIVVGVHIRHQNIAEGDGLLLAGVGVADDHHIAAVHAILAEGGGVEGGVHIFQRQLVAEGAIELQIGGNALIYSVGGRQHGNLHIGVQAVQKVAAGVGDGVELFAGQILPGRAGGDQADGQIDHDHNGDGRQNGHGGK